jgi:AcrR family transcriptional regulator
VPEAPPAVSPRRDELLERAYAYTLEHGLTGVSLRPLAAATGTSPRVLLFLFGSKDDLVRALLARARTDELALLDRVRRAAGAAGDPLSVAAAGVWRWLAADEHRALLALWAEGYARSIAEPDGPWGGFAAATVRDWLGLFAELQRPGERDRADAGARRTAVLAILRGGLLDLLATGDEERVTAAVTRALAVVA